MIKKFIKTNVIYSEADCLMVELKYNKGVGYEVEVSPVKKMPMGFSVLFDREYFAYYESTHELILPCGRKSAKKEAEAMSLFDNIYHTCVQNYCNKVLCRGGKSIVVDWETAE